MAHLLVRQRVEDFDPWKAAFDTDVVFRCPAGSLGGHVFQSADNPNQASVLMAWDTMENLQQFAQSEKTEGENATGRGDGTAGNPLPSTGR